MHDVGRGPGCQRELVDGIDLGAEEPWRPLRRREIVFGCGEVQTVRIRAEQRLVTDAQHAAGVRRVDRVDGVGPQRIARLADREERVGPSRQIAHGGIDIGLEDRMEPVACVGVEVALGVAEEWPEPAGLEVDRRRQAIEHVESEPRGRVLALLCVEQADREVDFFPEERRGAERPTAQALVRWLDLEALREHGVPDVQSLEPALHLVGDNSLSGDRRRLQSRARTVFGGLAIASLLERRELLRRRQIAQRRPIRRVLGSGSRVAEIDDAELLDTDGGPGGVRLHGHAERQRGSGGGNHGHATYHGLKHLPPPVEPGCRDPAPGRSVDRPMRGRYASVPAASTPPPRLRLAAGTAKAARAEAPRLQRDAAETLRRQPLSAHAPPRDAPAAAAVRRRVRAGRRAATGADRGAGSTGPDRRAWGESPDGGERREGRYGRGGSGASARWVVLHASSIASALAEADRWAADPAVAAAPVRQQPRLDHSLR